MCPQAKYVIVGDGPEKSSLEKLIRSLGLTEPEKPAGEKIDRVAQILYEKASIFVLPSIVTAKGSEAKGSEEEQGLVLQEAQASGIPIITSNGGESQRVR